MGLDRGAAASAHDPAQGQRCDDRVIKVTNTRYEIWNQINRGSTGRPRVRAARGRAFGIRKDRAAGATRERCSRARTQRGLARSRAGRQPTLRTPPPIQPQRDGQRHKQPRPAHRRSLRPGLPARHLGDRASRGQSQRNSSPQALTREARMMCHVAATAAPGLGVRAHIRSAARGGRRLRPNRPRSLPGYFRAGREPPRVSLQGTVSCPQPPAGRGQRVDWGKARGGA